MKWNGTILYRKGGNIMKNAKMLVLSILATIAVAVPVAASTTQFLEGGKLIYIYDSGLQLNGKWAECTLQSDYFEKKATACVGVCSTSGWVPKTEYTAHVKDVGSYFDTAYTRYNYR